MNKYAVLGAIIVIILVVGLFGAHFGYSVDGVPQRQDAIEDDPGLVGVVTYLFDSLGFLFSMVTFQIDGMPVWISSIFLFMSFMALALIISLVRGTE